MATVSISPSGDWIAAINALNPGDIGILQAGTFINPSGVVSVSGSSGNEITLRGTGYLESIIDGEGDENVAFNFENADYLIIENLQITNWTGIDGTIDYSATPRAALKEGLRLYQCTNITIQKCRFYRISTRALFITGAGTGNDTILIQDCVFFENSDDTAGGDISLGDTDNDNVTVKYCLFAGNVDGIVNSADNFLIEYNLFMFEKHENCIDIKSYATGNISTIRYNVIYGKHCDFGPVNFQNGAEDVHFHGNIIVDSGSASNALRLSGEGGSNIDEIEIVGNWFHGTAEQSVGNAIRFLVDTTETISNVNILHNIFSGSWLLGVQVNDPTAITLSKIQNNIFQNRGDAVNESSAGVDGTTNIYDDMTAWTDDAAPILATPIYETVLVGPVTIDSRGKGEATVLAGHDYGNDIGIPTTFENLMTLEKRIARRLLQTFSLDHIKECYARGEIHFEHPLEAIEVPKLLTLDLSYTYSLAELPLVPNPPFSAARDFSNTDNVPTDGTGRHIDASRIRNQNVFRFTFNADFDQARELQQWFKRGAFYLDTAENDVTSRFLVVWREGRFESPVEPGGRYTVSGVWVTT